MLRKSWLAYLLCFFALALAQPTISWSANKDSIAVLIANSDYQNDIPGVSYALNDGDAMRTFLIDVLGYRDGNIIDLRNASQAEMLAVLGSASDHEGKLWSWVRPGRSDVLVYYSGHGVPSLKSGKGYLLPVDADPATPAINGYPLEVLYKNLSLLQARSTTVLIDACFSGGSAAGMLIRSASPVYVRAEPVKISKDITVLTASQGDQIASWDEIAGLGLFTNFALKGLYGEADKEGWGNGDGQISLGELKSYLDDEMSYAARRQHRRVQQVSMAGNPATVLVADVPDRSAPTPPPQVASFPPKQPEIKGLYDPPNGDPAKSHAFFAQNRWQIEQAIRSYYKSEGYIWDETQDAWNSSPAEEIERFSKVQIIGLSATGFRVRAYYSWIGHGLGDISDSGFDIEISTTDIKVVRMWK